MLGSTENQTDGVVAGLLIPLMHFLLAYDDSVAYGLVKKRLSESQAERKYSGGVRTVL